MFKFFHSKIFVKKINHKIKFMSKEICIINAVILRFSGNRKEVLKCIETIKRKIAYIQPL